MARGDWHRYDAKTAAEDCLDLDVNYLNRTGVLIDGMVGSLWWTSSATGERRGTVGYRTTGDLFTLSYARNGEPVTLPVRLLYTTPHYGGRRPWFRCPLIVAGVPCERRVGKLYLRSKLFGCRHCHDLTYRSVQEAHADERAFAGCGLDPRGAKWLREDARFMEALKRKKRHRAERAQGNARRAAERRRRSRRSPVTLAPDS
ncbi:hypothetical protein [Alienimonas sp. DA493]|uniref:hypothetical protein n=1 Tax=Alienimonas sp. DA493 TaxID=3373605 RepID=UPI0037553298